MRDPFPIKYLLLYNLGHCFSHNLKLGTFVNEEGELERFLSSENVKKVTKGIPAQCRSCSNIYDNMLLFSLQKLFRTNSNQLNFYEIIK